MSNIAIIDKAKTKINYRKYFDFDFNEYHLCDSNLKKVLKKDISEEFINNFDANSYEYVILIGAEPCKHVANITSVIKYQGYLCEDKFLPLTNPAMLKFKPDAEPAFLKAVNDIKAYINGENGQSSKLELNIIDDEKEAIEYVEYLENLDITHIGVDSETTALYPRNGYVLGLCLAPSENEGAYLVSDILSDSLLDRLQKIFNRVTAVFHNAKFDKKFLKYHFDLNFPKWEDTMLIHYTLDENSPHDLKYLAIKYTDLGDYDKDLEEFKKVYCKVHKILQKDFTYDLIPFDILGKYGAIDPVATLRLFNFMYPKIEKSRNLNNVYHNILKPGTDFLIQVENTGIPFDKDILLETQKELDNSINELHAKLYDFEEVHKLEKIINKQFNPNSVQMVRQLLFDITKLPIPSKRTETGAISVDAEVLKDLAEIHELPKLILKIKKEKKIKSTYIDKILEGLDSDGRIRTGFNLTTTTSGRLSSSGKLNAQQFPRDDKRPKKAIRAEKGYKIVNADLMY